MRMRSSHDGESRKHGVGTAAEENMVKLTLWKKLRVAKQEVTETAVSSLKMNVVMKRIQLVIERS